MQRSAETCDPHDSRKLKDESGFTLPEAVVSLTVLAVVLALLTAGLVASLNGIRRAKVNAIMSNYAQARIEELNAIEYDDLGYTTGSPSGVLLAGTQFATVQGINLEFDIDVSYVGSSTGLDVIERTDNGGAPIDGDGVDGVFDFGIDYKLVEVEVRHVDGLINPVTFRTVAAPPDIGAHEGTANVIVTLSRHEPFAGLALADANPQTCLTQPFQSYISPDLDDQQDFAGIVPNSGNPADVDFWYDILLCPGFVVTDGVWHIMPDSIETKANRAHAPVTNTSQNNLAIYQPAEIEVNIFDAGSGLPITTDAQLILDDGANSTSFPHDLSGTWDINTIDGYPLVPNYYDITVFADGYVPVVMSSYQLPSGYPGSLSDTLNINMTPDVTVFWERQFIDVDGRPIHGVVVDIDSAIFPTPIAVESDANGQIGIWLTVTSPVTAGATSPYGHDPIPPAAGIPGPGLVTFVMTTPPTSGLVLLDNAGPLGDYGYRGAGGVEAFTRVLSNSSNRASVALEPGDYDIVKMCDDGSEIDLESWTVTAGSTITYNPGGPC